MKSVDNKIRVGVLVSGGGTNLQALIDAQSSGIISSAEITAVISNKKNAYAVERAKNAGINNYTITKDEVGSLKSLEEEIIKVLEKEEVDLIVLAGFMMILSSNFVSRYENRIINVHPSLIPSFCGKGYYGLRVHRAALEYGVKITGATVHFVNEIADAGRIIMQRAVEVLDEDTAESLQQRVMAEAEHIILPLAVEKLAGEMLKERGAI